MLAVTWASIHSVRSIRDMPDGRRADEPGGSFFFTLVGEGRQRGFADAHSRHRLGSILRCAQFRGPLTINAVVLWPVMCDGRRLLAA